MDLLQGGELNISGLRYQLDHYRNLAEDWITYSSVSRNYPPSFSHKIRSMHGGIKPPELCLELLFAYGKNCKSLIDPFVGVGSTLIAASLLNLTATGIDINPTWKELYLKVCKENNVAVQQYIVGDSSKILEQFLNNSFDIVLTDVPYFNMDKLTKTRGKFSKAGEPPRNKLPSSIQKFNDQEILSKEKWEYLLYTVFQQLFHFLTPNSPLIIFIGNMYRNIQPSISNSKKKIGQYLPLNSFLSSILLNIGYYWIKELIWMDPGKKLGVYGYPYVWIPSMMDQRILIFKKP